MTKIKPPEDFYDNYEPTDEDLRFSEYFIALAKFIHSLENESMQRVTLFLSSCRNSYLTINSLHETLSSLLKGNIFSPISKFIEHIKSHSADKAERFRRGVGRTLNSFKEKRSIWKKRKSIYNYLSKKIAEMPKSGRDYLSFIINSTRNPSGTNGLHPWDNKYSQVNTRQPSHHAQHYEALDKQYKILTAVYIICSNIASCQEIQGSLLESTLPENYDKLIQSILINEDILSCSYVHKDGRFLVIPEQVHEIEPFSLLSAVEINGSKEINLPKIDKFIDFMVSELVSVDRSLNSTPFKPNYSPPPLPDNFKLDLREQAPDKNIVQSIDINTIERCDPESLPERVVIGLLKINEPIIKHYNTQRISYKNNEGRKYISNVVREIIAEAARREFTCVLMPEVFLPIYDVEELHEFARTQNISFIGGLESTWRDGKRVNRAIISLPNEEYYFSQFKLHPSVFEVGEEDHYKKNQISVFQTKQLGIFSVIICSDLLELDLISSFASAYPMPEIFFVCTANPATKLFANIAKTDAYRFYSHVLLSNNPFPKVSEFDTFHAAPISSNKEPSQPYELYKVPNAGGLDVSLVKIELDLNAIRKRGHRKQDKGYMTSPYSRKSNH